MSTVIRPTTKGQFPKLRTGVYDVALGNMTQFRIAVIQRKHGVMVGIIGKGCYEFTMAPHWTYISEKLGIHMAFKGDAMNLADFIACQMGLEGRKPVGEYMAKLCSDEPHRSAPTKPKPVTFDQVSALRMVAGGEKTIDRVIHEGELCYWTGIGWVVERTATPEDELKYPAVVATATAKRK